MTKRYSIFVILLVLVAALSGCSGQEAVVEAVETAGTAVEVVRTEPGSLSQEAKLAGKLLPHNTVVIVPEVMGIESVHSIEVSLGQEVQAGDTLVILDDSNVNDQVEQARIAYETSLSNYQQMKDSYDSALKNYERTLELYEVGAVSQQQLEAAEMQASKSQLRMIESQLEQSELAYKTAKKQMDNTMITTPISGIVSELNVSEDGYVTSQSTVVISDISKLKLEVDLTENVINDVSVGTNVEVEVPSASDLAFDGEITYLNVIPDARTGLYKAVIEVENPSYDIKPGMVANVTIYMDPEGAYYIIPTDCLLSDDGGDYVYTVNEANKATKRYVEVGVDNGEITEIISGLTTDDRVIYRGQEFLSEDEDVNVVRGE